LEEQAVELEDEEHNGIMVKGTREGIRRRKLST